MRLLREAAGSPCEGEQTLTGSSCPTPRDTKPVCIQNLACKCSHSFVSTKGWQQPRRSSIGER